MCSPFSPVLKFEDQAAARALAEASLAALLDESLHPDHEKKAASAAKQRAQVSRRDLFSGFLAERGQ